MERGSPCVPERLAEVTETPGSTPPPPQLLEAIANLAEFHREHEKYYSQAPLRQAVEVQAASRALKALAGRWSAVVPAAHPAASPFAGAEDLNAPGLVAESGVLFMEGEGEPAEIKRLRRDLGTLADDVEQTGEWLGSPSRGCRCRPPRARRKDRHGLEQPR